MSDAGQDFARKREQIVFAALNVAMERGLSAITVRSVAKESRMSPGIVHYYFSSKEELMEEVTNMVLLQLNDEAVSALIAASGAEDAAEADVGLVRLRKRVRALALGLWHSARASPGYQLLPYEIGVMSVRAEGQGNPVSVASRQYSSVHEWIVAFFTKEAQEAFTTWKEPVASVARTAFCLIDGILLRWLVDGDDEAALEQFETLVDVVVAKAR